MACVLAVTAGAEERRRLRGDREQPQTPRVRRNQINPQRDVFEATLTRGRFIRASTGWQTILGPRLPVIYSVVVEKNARPVQ